jgi:hypothetical protein
MTIVGSMFWDAKKLSMTLRVADPTSKRTNGSCARSRAWTLRRLAS